jgi:hypothetical protein
MLDYSNHHIPVLSSLFISLGVQVHLVRRGQGQGDMGVSKDKGRWLSLTRRAYTYDKVRCNNFPLGPIWVEGWMMTATERLVQYSSLMGRPWEDRQFKLSTRLPWERTYQTEWAGRTRHLPIRYIDEGTWQKYRWPLRNLNIGVLPDILPTNSGSTLLGPEEGVHQPNLCARGKHGC